ncbi:MAG: UDP-N-acetylmuramoyl-L-alanine--D-glutamate ligase [Desulfurivibrionaceae bacterium]
MAPTEGTGAKVENGTRSLVVGLGRSGIAAAKLLHKLGGEVTGLDSAPANRLDKNFLDWAGRHHVHLECGSRRDRLPPEIELVVISPGVPLNLPLLTDARARGVKVIGELALAAALVSIPTVAVTGTNGKSTVTELIGEMFRRAGRRVFVGGNLGSPLSEYLLDPFGAEVLVLEVSSFQLDTAPDFRPEVGVLLNISPDHLDRYDDYEHYAASKFSLFGAQNSDDAAILNGDDPEITGRLASADLPGRRFFFGQKWDETGRGAKIEGPEIMVRGIDAGKNERYRLGNSPLVREPNPHNAAAAIIAARLLGCPEQAIAEALAGFKPLGHRLEKIAEIDGVHYLDDSKATNIGAVAAALAGMTRPVVLIAGGRDKGGDYRLMREMVGKKVKAMVLIGEAREKMAEAFQEVTRVKSAADLAEAVNLARSLAEKGDAVLLSPACASFDMFRSYGHRGEVFQEAVLALQDKENSGHPGGTDDTIS